LMGSLAQIGLALATAVGVWTNLLLVLFFAVRRGFLVPDRAWLLSLAKFLLTGIILAAAFWLIARFGGPSLGAMPFRDELTLLLLAVGGTIVYALAILALFGRRWLVSLVRG
jgi:putative peptidoglycan lipid II flippase